MTFTGLQMQPQAAVHPNEIIGAPRSELKNLNKIFQLASAFIRWLG